MKNEKLLSKDLKSFIAHLRKNHLKDVVKEQIGMTAAMDIPLQKLFPDFTKQQIIEMTTRCTEEFLVALEGNNAFDIAKKSMQQWETNMLEEILKQSTQSANCIRICSLQKKALYYFIPGYTSNSFFWSNSIKKALYYFLSKYTSDSQELISISEELENYYTRIQQEGMRTYVGLQKKLLAETINSQYTQSLVDAIYDPLFIISMEGKIIDVNNASKKATGLSRQELTGSYFFNYFTDADKAREGCQQIFAKGFVADYPLIIKGSTFIDMSINGSVYEDDKGNIMGAVIVARDMTAQIIDSQYARNLIEFSNDPLFAINLDGKITDMNQASVKTTGIPRKKLVGTYFFNYFTEPNIAVKGYKEIFSKGFIKNLPLTLMDGKFTEVLFNGSAYKDNRGNMLGAVVIARDVTELRKIEKELRSAKEAAELIKEIAEEAKTKAEIAKQKAEDTTRSKQQFLSNMSHEIRTPMNAIIGFTKVILKTDLNEKQTEYIDAIKSSGETLMELINDILDLAKVNAGKITFEQLSFKMETSISTTLRLFETKIQEKNLELVKEYDSRIPEVMLGDPARLQQIILNLMSNAIKFTTKGKITLSVRILNENNETATIEFAVTDSGIGIPENKIKNLFENFGQVSDDTSRLYGGTGLGLAIVKQLVEQQGGSVAVKSKEGKGSTFSFVLSFKKTNEKMMEAKIDKGVVLDPEIKNIKVLAVEDNALNQLLLKTLLDDFGFEHDSAKDGKIAIEKLEKKPYDIILMDLQMPEMNGFEVTKYIRQKMNSKIPIIALSADVTTADVEKCKTVGMNDYVSKPIDEQLLYNKIIMHFKKPDFKKTIDMKAIEVIPPPMVQTAVGE